MTEADRCLAAVRAALPDGWRRDPMPPYGGHYEVMVHPKGALATIDFRNRCIRGGYSTFGVAMKARRTYAGRHWRRDLCEDAVAWLTSIYEPKKGMRS